ncbi:MAG: hypothetical protein HQK83_03085 [Fibrobacteria bacterium]|nr:hypothetical protein [Fibrobacteria bacterium]
MKKPVSFFSVTIMVILSWIYHGFTAGELVSPVFKAAVSEESASWGSMELQYGFIDIEKFSLIASIDQIPVHTGILSYYSTTSYWKNQPFDLPRQALFYSLPVGQHTLSLGLEYSYQYSDYKYFGDHEYCYDWDEGECVDDVHYQYLNQADNRMNHYVLEAGEMWRLNKVSSLLASARVGYNQQAGFSYYENYYADASDGKIPHGTAEYRNYNEGDYDMDYQVNLGYWKKNIFGLEKGSLLWRVSGNYSHSYYKPVIQRGFEPYYNPSDNQNPITVKFIGSDSRMMKLETELAYGESYFERVPLDRPLRKGWLNTYLAIPRFGIRLGTITRDYDRPTIIRWQREDGYSWGYTEPKSHTFYLNAALFGHVRLYMLKHLYMDIVVNSENLLQFFQDYRIYEEDAIVDWHIGYQQVIKKKIIFDVGVLFTKMEIDGWSNSRWQSQPSFSLDNKPFGYLYLKASLLR